LSLGSVVGGLLELPLAVVGAGAEPPLDVTVARAAGARVVVERRRGYGRACAAGVAATACDIVLFLDGDGSDDASALPVVVAPLLAGEVNLSLGRRVSAGETALPWHARAGNGLAAALITLLWRQPVTDLPSCKAIRRDDLLELGLTEVTYGWTIELIVKAARRGWLIREQPVSYRPRVGGISKVSGNPWASLKAAVAILRVLATHALARGDGWPGGARHAPGRLPAIRRE